MGTVGKDDQLKVGLGILLAEPLMQIGVKSRNCLRYDICEVLLALDHGVNSTLTRGRLADCGGASC